MEHSRASGISHIAITAGLFVVALVGISAWQAIQTINEKNTPTFVATASPNAQTGASAEGADALSTLAGTDTDPVAAVSSNALGELVGAYTGLQEEGQYSTSSAEQIAGTIGEGLQTPVSYSAYSEGDIKTSPDTSYNAMMQYRAGLQASLKPLLANTTPEYAIFGMYVETKQQTYLDQLHAAAANYRAAASSSAALTVPADALSVELGLVNSMEEFAATLDSLADHAQDPIASSVLLENYNQAESDVLNSFQALVTYEKSKAQ